MSSYKNKIVAVTGGNGFIGSRLAERLAFEEGAQVKVLVRTWHKATWVSRANVKLIQGDITQIDSLEPLLRDVEIVFNCAMSGNPVSCRSVNVEGTRNILDACVKFGVKRIVHFSTIGVHGPYLHEGMDENAPFIKNGNPYADSKIEAEQLFWNYLSDKNLEGVVVRPTYVWGPNSPWFTVVPVKNIIEKRFALVDEGKGACNAVYVDNVVDLAVLAGLNSRAVGEAFFIRDPDRITWREFFGYYAVIAKVDPAELNSVSSIENRKTVLSRNIQKVTNEAKKNLTIYIDKYGERYPFVVRYGLRAPRKSLGMIERIIESVAPTTYNLWDLKKYSSPGHISIEKAKKLLDYWPRISVEDGMNATETWLKEQNYVPNSPSGHNSKYDRSELS